MAHPESPGPRFPLACTRWHLLEGGFLFLLVAGFGLLLVPAHWTSIWMDREFSGWVAPIANRLATGQVLYTDGAHLPLPPLPFVLIYWFTGGHATWLTESFLNFVCTGALILALYAGLSLFFARPLPFLAAGGAAAFMLGLPKGMLYDSMAQLAAGLLGLTAVWYVLMPSGPVLDRASGRRGWGAQALFGLLTAVCLLSKQSTGIGAGLGAVLLLSLFPRGAPWGARLRSAGRYVVATGAALVLLLIVLAPWADVAGLNVDLFLTGSEPKGGAGQLLLFLVSYAVETFRSGLLTALTFLVVCGFLAWLWRWRPGPGSASAPPREGPPPATGAPGALWGAGAVVAGALCLYCFGERFLFEWEFLVWQALALGLGVGLLITVLYCSPRGANAGRADLAPWAALMVALLPPAVFHSLSGGVFRWYYDANALIAVVLAVVFWGVLCSAQPWPARRLGFRLAVGLVIFALQFALWSRLGRQVAAARECTEAWPEVRFLSGARLRPQARGMRALVKVVRELAPDPERDAVLLLPNDPNVEAWFERPRPKLSSAIIFSDQYWDRYVDLDFARLKQDPPKVIVIGPRNYWRDFQRIWHQNTGAERLIDLVDKELLPEGYDPDTAQEIGFQGRTDYMDVYVRKEAAAAQPPSPPPAP